MKTSAMTILERNTLLAQRVWSEVWHQGNFSAMDEIFDPNFIRHDPNGRELRGREQNEQFIRQTRATFPDLQFRVEAVIANADKVVMRYRFQGTHLGDALVFPPTGQNVTYTGILIQRFLHV